MTKGREVPALPTVTLPISGYTVEVRPIGPLTLQELRRAINKEILAPTAPTNRVTGLDGQEHDEPNPADPDYITATVERANRINGEIGTRMLKLIAVRGVATTVDTEAVQRVRDDLGVVGIPLPDDDREVFVSHVLIAGDEDLAALRQAIFEASMVTPEVVASKIADFRDHVQEA